MLVCGRENRLTDCSETPRRLSVRVCKPVVPGHRIQVLLVTSATQNDLPETNAIATHFSSYGCDVP